MFDACSQLQVPPLVIFASPDRMRGRDLQMPQLMKLMLPPPYWLPKAPEEGLLRVF